MDPERPSGVAKVQVALLLVPSARTRRGAKADRPPLLVNPGGPGGSGVATVLSAGEQLRSLMGGGEDQDVIGFDPRGVGATTPRADCWTPVGGDPFAAHARRVQWNAMGAAVGLINSSDTALRRQDARVRASNAMCREKDRRAGGADASILRYASTAFVARDMLSIVDAWDAWQETLPRSNGTQPSPPQNKTVDSKPKRRDADAGAAGLPPKGKLVYWGFSYGSYLGVTFAKMFPDRVGRVVIDGNVNPYQWGASLQSESLHDTDAGLSDLFKHCFEVGARCQFRRDGDAGPADIEAQFWALLDRLDRDPPVFAYPANSTSRPATPVVVTSDLVKSYMFNVLYNPILSAFEVDSMLSHLHDGNAEWTGDYFRVQEPPSLCDSSTRPAWGLPDDSLTAVSCGDKREPVNDTLADIQAKFERHAATSRFADVFMGLGVDMECNHWGIPSASRNRPGPWDPSQEGNATETAFPLLVLSNTYDPVTPLKSGLVMAAAFKGAGFVEQRSGGHASVSAASACTAQILRAYFVDGKTPPPPPPPAGRGEGGWTTCEVDELPFKGRTSTVEPRAAGGEDEMQHQVEAVREALAAASRVGAHKAGSPISQADDIP
ncbi:hypothetical protein RB601_005313 [Gaeumannomyces tritici]